MTFGRGPLLLQKYKILPKRRKKTNIVTLKVHNRQLISIAFNNIAYTPFRTKLSISTNSSSYTNIHVKKRLFKVHKFQFT